MGSHIVDGEFQSDKYPACPRGKVPLSVKDPTAQDLLWEYAQRRRAVDAEFSDDLESALLAAGYEARTSAATCQGCHQPAVLDALDGTMRCDACRAQGGLPRLGRKHGPGGRGLSGPCDAECAKCAAERGAGADAFAFPRDRVSVDFSRMRTPPGVSALDPHADLTDAQLDGMALWNVDEMLTERHRPVGAMLVGRAVAEIRRRRAASPLTSELSDACGALGDIMLEMRRRRMMTDEVFRLTTTAYEQAAKKAMTDEQVGKRAADAFEAAGLALHALGLAPVPFVPRASATHERVAKLEEMVLDLASRLRSWGTDQSGYASADEDARIADEALTFVSSGPQPDRPWAEGEECEIGWPTEQGEHWQRERILSISASGWLRGEFWDGNEWSRSPTDRWLRRPRWRQSPPTKSEIYDEGGYYWWHRVATGDTYLRKVGWNDGVYYMHDGREHKPSPKGRTDELWARVAGPPP